MQIHIFALLLTLQSFTACLHDPEGIRIVAGSAAPLEKDLLRETVDPGTPETGIFFRSADGGRTWQDLSAGIPRNVFFPHILACNGELFLVSENSLYRNSGSAEAPEWNKVPLLHGPVMAIAPGRAGAYACCYDYGVFQNIPGTDIWNNISGNLVDKSARTLVETPDGSLILGTDKGIFKSADKGQTWKQVYDGGLGLNIVESDGVLICGGLQGVLRSTDGGEHWETVLNENILAKKTGLIGDRFVTILGTMDPKKFNFEGITSRLRTSADGGKTWHRIEQRPLPVNGSFHMDMRLWTARDIYDIVQSGEFLFCSFDTGVFRSSDGGINWEPVLSTEGKKVYNITVSGQIIYAVVGNDGC